MKYNKILIELEMNMENLFDVRWMKPEAESSNKCE
jgi:hypothetical protein